MNKYAEILKEIESLSTQDQVEFFRLENYLIKFKDEMTLRFLQKEKPEIDMMERFVEENKFKDLLKQLGIDEIELANRCFLFYANNLIKSQAIPANEKNDRQRTD